MIRTGGRDPAVRIVFVSRSGTTALTAIDPQSGEQCVIAPAVDNGTLDALNNYLWEKLNAVTQLVQSDPLLAAAHGQEVLCRIYQAGFGALLRLMGPSYADHIDEVQKFFRDRIKQLVSADQDPPIIDVVTNQGGHFPIEVLPLLGKAENCADGSTALRETAKTLPGYCSVVRRVELSPDDGLPRHDNDVHYSKKLAMRFFRHNSLRGVQLEIEHLRKLEHGGALILSSLYPPRGHTPARFWPELPLAKIVADPFAGGGGIPLEQASHVCHFSCHIRENAPGGPYLELRPDHRWSRESDRYLLDQIIAARGHVPLVPPGSLVVFLSACKSGARDRRLFVSAVDVFRFFKPRSLIGALANLPEIAAAEFAVAFYRELAAGSSVGAALRAARLHLLDRNEYNNPLGLLFCSYFGEDVFVPVSSDRVTKYVPEEKVPM